MATLEALAFKGEGLQVAYPSLSASTRECGEPHMREAKDRSRLIPLATGERVQKSGI